MRRVFLLAASLCLPPFAAAQEPKAVVDGQPLLLHGTLTMSPEGRLQFVTVATAETYIPGWRDEHGKRAMGEPLHGVALDAPIPYAVLYANRGQHITVFGKLAVDEASPYFWHATRLHVTSLKLANGTDLLKEAAKAAPRPAPGATYVATAVLPADLAEPWHYRMAGNGKTSVPADGLLRCSSNGGGDVVNCACADGFEATMADAALGGTHVAGRLMRTAQFDVADEDGKTNIATTLVVTCTRTK